MPLPLPLRDTFLRVGQQKLFEVRWSRRILDEVARNLVKDRRATPEETMKLVDVMQRAFEDAEVPQAAIASLDPVMFNEPADRHVLAAAAASDAEAIVTSNIRHFPPARRVRAFRHRGRAPRRIPKRAPRECAG